MATLSPAPKLQFFDNDGKPAAGFKLYTYAAGTTTPQATYSNREGTVANSNPIILDARGEAVVYLAPGLAYDFALTMPNDTPVWTRNGISSADVGGVFYGSGNVVSVFADSLEDLQTQQAALGTETVRIQNDADNHVRLVTGSHVWLIRVVASNGTLRIEPASGSADLYLGKNVQFGEFDSSADAAVNGYITIKDENGVTRKLATIA